ncbi:hypothetical protein [Methylobacterium sp. D48H]
MNSSPDPTRLIALCFGKAAEAADGTVSAAASFPNSLYAMPATTPVGILLKLVVLSSLGEPGAAERDASLWRELRLILLDLSAIDDRG